MLPLERIPLLTWWEPQAGESVRMPLPIFYHSREVKELGTEAVKIGNSRIMGILFLLAAAGQPVSPEPVFVMCLEEALILQLCHQFFAVMEKSRFPGWLKEREDREKSISDF